MTSPLITTTIIKLGPIPITTPVIVTWAIMALLVLGSITATRRLSITPSRFQAVLEAIVEAVDSQIQDTMRVGPDRYRALIGTLFLYILLANWSSLVPGVEPPTAHVETDAAMAILVFLAAIYFGIRTRGVAGYLRTFAQPSFVMIPLNIAEAFTRAFSMTVRLFGNVMSGVFIIGVVLSLAGLFVPIPLMALDLLTGAIQAYIFTILSMVFIASAIGEDTQSQTKGYPHELDSDCQYNGSRARRLIWRHRTGFGGRPRRGRGYGRNRPPA
jgi:F-type H+-transporting ATPase subunit a